MITRPKIGMIGLIVLLFVIFAMPVLTSPWGAFIIQNVATSFYSREDVTALAVRKNDPSLCRFMPGESLTDMKNKYTPCYIAVATANKNPKACDHISTEDPDLGMRQNCYITLGIPFRDAASRVCPKVGEHWSRQADCYEFFADKANDRSVCDDDTNDTVRAKCILGFVFRSKNPDANTCEERMPYVADRLYPDYSYNGSFKDQCYHGMAANETVLNLALCEKIDNQELVVSCRKAVTLRLKALEPPIPPTPLPIFTPLNR